MSSFLADCGHPNGLGILLRSSDGKVWHGQHLETPFALIGTAEPAQVRIADEEVWPRHAYLQVLPGRLFVFDLTGNRSIVADGEAAHSAWLDVPAEFQLGSFNVRVAGVDESPRCDTPAADEAAAVELQWNDGQPGRTSVTSHKDISLIGSGRLCEFRVHSERVDAVHCSLVKTGGGLWAVDLGCAEGTFVNDQPITCARLSAECRLTLGDGIFDVRVTGLPTPPEPEIIPPATRSLLPAKRRDSAEVSHTSPTERADLPTDVVRDVVSELSRSQDRALDQTRELMLEILSRQEQTVNHRVDSLQRQNEQLLKILQSVLERNGSTTNGQPAPSQPRLEAPSPPAGHEQDLETIRKQLAQIGPDVQDAWIRGQLQTIADRLHSENDTRMKKLLRRLLPADANDAFK